MFLFLLWKHQERRCWTESNLDRKFQFRASEFWQFRITRSETCFLLILLINKIKIQKKLNEQTYNWKEEDKNWNKTDQEQSWEDERNMTGEVGNDFSVEEEELLKGWTRMNKLFYGTIKWAVPELHSREWWVCVREGERKDRNSGGISDNEGSFPENKWLRANLILFQHLALGKGKTTAPQSEMFWNVSWNSICSPVGRIKASLQPKDKWKPVWCTL